MKTLLISLFALCLPFLASAQNFEKYENMPHVSQVVITQNMFKLLSGIEVDSTDSDVHHFVDLAKSLDKIEILSTGNATVAKAMRKDFDGFVDSSDLKELMLVKKDGKNIRFYSKPGSASGKISQLLMIMSAKGDDENHFVILSITGDINLNEIANMADIIHVPGAKELKNLKSE